MGEFLLVELNRPPLSGFPIAAVKRDNADLIVKSARRDHRPA